MENPVGLLLLFISDFVGFMRTRSIWQVCRAGQFSVIVHYPGESVLWRPYTAGEDLSTDCQGLVHAERRESMDFS